MLLARKDVDARNKTSSNIVENHFPVKKDFVWELDVGNPTGRLYEALWKSGKTEDQ